MKTITEFTVSTLKNALKTKQDLSASGKTAEELPAAMGEALKLEGDKLTLLLSALEVVEKKTNDLKRVVVWSLAEGETAPRGTEKKGEHYFGIEFFPPMPGQEPKRHGRGKGRDAKGGRDKDKRGKGRGRGPRRDDQRQGPPGFVAPQQAGARPEDGATPPPGDEGRRRRPRGPRGPRREGAPGEKRAAAPAQPAGPPPKIIPKAAATAPAPAPGAGESTPPAST